MQRKIKAREIRLMSAVGALLIFAVATTTPGGGFTCCGTLEEDITVTFINQYELNVGLGYGDNIIIIIVDAKTNGKIDLIKIWMKYPGEPVTKTLPSKVYLYTVFETGGILGLAPTDVLIQTGTILDDTTISIVKKKPPKKEGDSR